jgi:hypothetical protein
LTYLPIVTEKAKTKTPTQSGGAIVTLRNVFAKKVAKTPQRFFGGSMATYTQPEMTQVTLNRPAPVKSWG